MVGVNNRTRWVCLSPHRRSSVVKSVDHHLGAWRSAVPHRHRGGRGRRRGNDVRSDDGRDHRRLAHRCDRRRLHLLTRQHGYSLLSRLALRRLAQPARPDRPSFHRRPHRVRFRPPGRSSSPGSPPCRTAPASAAATPPAASAPSPPSPGCPGFCGSSSRTSSRHRRAAPSRKLKRPGRTGDEGARPVRARHHHARVAVVHAQPVVVGRHQQRPADIPRRPHRLARLLGQPPLDLAVPVPHAIRPLPMRTQQPVLVECRSVRFLPHPTPRPLAPVTHAATTPLAAARPAARFR